MLINNSNCLPFCTHYGGNVWFQIQTLMAHWYPQHYIALKQILQPTHEYSFSYFDFEEKILYFRKTLIMRIAPSHSWYFMVFVEIWNYVLYDRNWGCLYFIYAIHGVIQLFPTRIGWVRGSVKSKQMGTLLFEHWRNASKPNANMTASDEVIYIVQ